MPSGRAIGVAARPRVQSRPDQADRCRPEPRPARSIQTPCRSARETRAGSVSGACCANTATSVTSTTSHGFGSMAQPSGAEMFIHPGSLFGREWHVRRFGVVDHGAESIVIVNARQGLLEVQGCVSVAR